MALVGFVCFCLALSVFFGVVGSVRVDLASRAICYFVLFPWFFVVLGAPVFVEGGEVFFCCLRFLEFVMWSMPPAFGVRRGWRPFPFVLFFRRGGKGTQRESIISVAFLGTSSRVGIA